jgi:hypothetical protein
MKIALFILGVAIAGAGGVLLYRAMFLEPPGSYVVTETRIHEIPNTAKIVGGGLMLIAGAAVAFFALRRTPR